jgi:hypothetical protein
MPGVSVKVTCYNWKQVEALVLIRDGLTMTLDGINQFLETTEPKETQPQYIISKIKTERTEGPNGFYQKATEANNHSNPNYEQLLKDLKAHNGKLSRDGVFVWLFNDNLTVGMKQSKR